ncbi:glycine zipper 2TM domain-containing protein [Photobacterium sp. Alg240-V54]|uniref:glycine zipper 2TM domain-containing protein n=1 Tax=Photobacterium sp. Alg240-V54 TaxID=2305995 RepID=UPI0013D61022|nr:glycine zipper 2TM domain-containing protein [Photobacterium sp. Alg240-V54]
MNKCLIISLSTIIALSSTLTGCNDNGKSNPNQADILSVKAATKTVSIPHKVCEQVAVTHHAAVKDENKLVGTGLGGAIGGVLGHQVGGGKGKTLATVAGAVAGRAVQDKYQAENTTTSMEQRCHNEYTKSDKIVGYDVTYKIGDKQNTIRMEKEPAGDTLPIKNGHLAI